MINNKAKVLTLILCGVALLMTFPTLAADSRDDQRKPSWRNQHENRPVEKMRKQAKEPCKDGQDCIAPARRDPSEKFRPGKPNQQMLRQEKAPPTKVRPTLRIEKRGHDRPPTRIENRDRDRPPTRIEIRDRDQPPSPRILPERRDVKIRHVKPVATVKRPKLRMSYGEHIRHEYRYIRGPWYNTRYITPLPLHHHRIGHRLKVLPRARVRIILGGIPYFYYTGVFYRPYESGYIVVSAPIGAFVKTLPVGFIAFTIGLSTYYYVNDTYYVWDENREGYFVVEKPAGAEEAIEKATTGRLMIYPNKGQSEEQQAKDRYECHRWAVTESGIDPSLEEQEFTASDSDNYRRAISACLEGRDYTVK
jgi:hypothetical protein